MLVETQAQLAKIISRTMNAEDHRTALEAMRERSKLSGIYAAEKTVNEITIHMVKR